jgi:hypothetical protein
VHQILGLIPNTTKKKAKATETYKLKERKMKKKKKKKTMLITLGENSKEIINKYLEHCEEKKEQTEEIFETVVGMSFLKLMMATKPQIKKDQRTPNR